VTIPRILIFGGFLSLFGMCQTNDVSDDEKEIDCPITLEDEA